MSITLKKAKFENCPEIYDLQIKSFRPLLEKYQDYDFSPGAESIERTYERFNQSFTDFWMIALGEKNIGVIRICDLGEICKLKQIFLLPAYQNHGYAQEAVKNPAASYEASNVQRSRAAGYLTLAAVAKWTCKHVRLARCSRQ